MVGVGPTAEQAADIRILVCGLLLGAVGTIILLRLVLAQGQPRLTIGAGIYVTGLLAMLGCSLLYRSALRSPLRPLLRRLDHAAIFAMIAGSATPFALGRNDGINGAALAAAIWTVAAIGIIAKLWFPLGGVGRSVIVYVLLGSASLVAAGPSISIATATLIAAGGAFYAIGLICLLSWRLSYRIAIWHAFVIAGAVCHYLAILDGVALR